MRTLFALSAVLLVLSCRGAGRRPKAPVVARAPTMRAVVVAERAPAGIPDRRIGLDPHPITDLPTPKPFAWDETLPTGSKALERAWHGMPPTIPHGIQDLLPITAEENACLGCHDPTNPDREVDDGKAMSKSHFLDYRQTPVVQRPQVVGTRYNCVLCHQQRTDAQPLVGNRYRR